MKLRHLWLKLLGPYLPKSWQSKLLLPAVCVLVTREDGKVLAVSRKNNPDAWGLPGGKVELNWYGKPIESHEEAIRRETQEETGLNLGELQVLYAGSAENEFWTVCYLSTAQGEIHTTETGRVAWVDWKEVLTGPFGTYNQVVKALYNIPSKKNRK